MFFPLLKDGRLMRGTFDRLSIGESSKWLYKFSDTMQYPTQRESWWSYGLKSEFYPGNPCSTPACLNHREKRPKKAFNELRLAKRTIKINN